MAMRPAVRRRALVLMVFAIAQWLFMRYILANGLFNIDTNQRILYFCVSSLGGALLIFVSLIYMVLKGNADKPEYFFSSATRLTSSYCLVVVFHFLFCSQDF